MGCVPVSHFVPLTLSVLTLTVMRWELSFEEMYRMGVCTTVTVILCSASAVVLGEGTCQELEPKWLHPIVDHSTVQQMVGLVVCTNHLYHFSTR